MFISRKRIAELEAKVSELRRRNDVLAQDVNILKQDLRAASHIVVPKISGTTFMHFNGVYLVPQETVIRLLLNHCGIQLEYISGTDEHVCLKKIQAKKFKVPS